MESLKFHRIFLFYFFLLFSWNVVAQNCTYTFDGSTKPCNGEMAIYTAKTPIGVQKIEWTLNNVKIGKDKAVTIDWNNKFGAFNLCMNVLDSCAQKLPKPACQTIQIKDKITRFIDTTLCSGRFISIKEPAKNIDTAFSVNGQHTYTYTTVDGCDSIINFNITIEQTPLVILPDTAICAGEVLSIGDSLLTTSGAKNIYVLNKEGCFELFRFHLEVRDSIITHRPLRVCYEDRPFIIEEKKVWESEKFDYYYKATNGCDSIVRVDVVVLPPEAKILFDTICSEDCFAIGDTCFNKTGRHRYVFKTEEGCDSTVTINLAVKKPKNSYDRINICAGDTLARGLVFWTTTGIYEYKATAADGCDSIVTYDLGVKEPKYTFIDTVICHGTCFDIYPNRLCVSGAYTYPYISSEECDSIVFVNLKIGKDLTKKLKETICFGDSMAIGDSMLYKTGHYEIMLEAKKGCDSLVIVDVIAKGEKDLVYELEEIICAGDCYDKIRDTLICEQGIYQITMPSADGCDSTIILNLIVINFPDVGVERIEICAGNCITRGESIYCIGGTYNLSYQTTEGCDSLVLLEIVVKDTIHVSISHNLCLDDSIKVGNLYYFDEGEYMETVSNNAGCDSIINFTIKKLDCNIETMHQVDTTGCNGENTGKITFYITKGNPPFTYDWQSPWENLSGKGIIDNLYQEIVFDSLPAGSYTIMIKDTMSGFKVLNIQVTEPDKFEHEWDTSDYHGFNISCKGEQDAFLEILPSGGTSPYTYKWNNGGVTSGLTDLAEGTYSVTVTDAMGCDFVATYEIKSPKILATEVEIKNPTCDSLATGKLSVISIEGGTSPYVYDLSGRGFSERNRYQALMPGTYTLTVKDANGCLIDFSAELPLPAIPELLFEKEVYIELGDEFPIVLESTVTLAKATWEGGEGLSCYDCIEPTAFPLETSKYTVNVTSVDGCMATKDLVVHVDKKRDVFVPNIFSPNGDGINDQFFIYSGPEVTFIPFFRIYSRWGALVYEGYNLSPNDATNSWDGRFQGKKLNVGTFIWIAQVAFIDGVVEEYTGEVVLK